MALAENHDRGGRVAGGRRWTAAPLLRPVDKVPVVPALAGRLVSREKARLATARLRTLRPDLSSSTRLWRWQTVMLTMLAVVLGAALLLAPDELATVVTVVLALPFFSVYLLRFLALRVALSGPRKGASELTNHRRLDDRDCPAYAVLAALYDEADIVPSLVAALTALDYPTSRLAIRLVVEEEDLRTRRALAGIALPSHMEVLVVPRGTPRTKPRALNVALDDTPGEIVVVYDAEDLPERDQLRKAAAAFRDAPEDLICVQARLNTFNPDESWLARQFTIEYSALFDLMLPALERYRLPVPLGGTSNHFRRAALQRVLAWDPYNVTEDADLGIRIARFGYRVGTINSTTWEEAPPRFRVWLGQRTRWLKGWMQALDLWLQPVKSFYISNLIFWSRALVTQDPVICDPKCVPTGRVK